MENHWFYWGFFAGYELIFFFAAFKIHKVCFFSNFINIYLSMHLCIYATWSSLRFLNTHTHTPFGKLNGIISSNVLSVSAVTSFSLGLLFYICWYIWWCHMFSLISGFFLKHHYWLFLVFFFRMDNFIQSSIVAYFS